MPYVEITHIPTGRTFYLDRGYNLLSGSNFTLDGMEIVSDWKGWKPTRKSQMPLWAVDIPENEFHALWAKPVPQAV